MAKKEKVFDGGKGLEAPSGAFDMGQHGKGGSKKKTKAPKDPLKWI